MNVPRVRRFPYRPRLAPAEELAAQMKAMVQRMKASNLPTTSYTTGTVSTITASKWIELTK